MELTLLAPVSESILTELYGWGEIPLEWITARGLEFTEQQERIAKNGGLDYAGLTAVLNTKEECDWKEIVFLPAAPEGPVTSSVNAIKLRMATLAGKPFKVQLTHADVECIAIM